MDYRITWAKRAISLLLVLLMLLSFLPMVVIPALADEPESDLAFLVPIIGSPDPNAMKIYTAQDLYDMRNDLTGSYVLMNNIDLSNYNNGEWIPLVTDDSGDFRGTFDGNGHTISNLKQTRNYGEFSGLFGRMSNASISNLAIECHLQQTADVESNLRMGSLAASAYTASISNCYVEGTIIASGGRTGYVGGLIGINQSSATVENCYNAADIFVDNAGQGKYVGGLIGENQLHTAKIVNSHNSGNITVTDVNTSSNDVRVGGVLGSNTGDTTFSGGSSLEIENSFNSGVLNVAGERGTPLVGGLVGYTRSTRGKIIEESYNSGNINVDGGGEVGGLIGRVLQGLSYNTSSISSSFNRGDISGNCRKGGLVGVINVSQGAFEIYDCYNSGTLSPTRAIGGLVGDCRSSSNGNSLSIIRSYNSGKLISSSYSGQVAGILGYVSSYDRIELTIKDCAVLSPEIVGRANYNLDCNLICAGVGSDTAILTLENNIAVSDIEGNATDDANRRISRDEAMQIETYFSLDWGFGTTWKMPGSGDGYPMLYWEEIYYPPSFEAGEVTWDFDDGVLFISVSDSGKMPDYMPEQEPWRAHKDEILHVLFDDTVTAIGAYAFYGYENLLSVGVDFKYKSSLRTIGAYAFANCERLGLLSTSLDAHSYIVEIPGSVRKIETGAFSGCVNLGKILIPESVTYFGTGTNVFAGCYKVDIECYFYSAAHLYAQGHGITHTLLDAPAIIEYAQYIYDTVKKGDGGHNGFSGYIEYTLETAEYYQRTISESRWYTVVENATLSFSEILVSAMVGILVGNDSVANDALEDMVKLSLDAAIDNIPNISNFPTEEQFIFGNAADGYRMVEDGCNFLQDLHQRITRSTGTVGDLELALNYIKAYLNIQSGMSALRMGRNYAHERWNRSPLENFSNVIEGYLEGLISDLILDDIPKPLSYAAQTHWRLTVGRMEELREYMRLPLVTQWIEETKQHKAEIEKWTRETQSDNSKTYLDKRIGIHCPVDVEIYDEEGELIISISDGALPQIAEDITAWTEDDAKFIYLPWYAAEYTIKLIATDTGIMSVDVWDTDLIDNSTTNHKMFNSVQLTSGKQMIITVSGETAVNETRLYVLDNDGEPVAEVRTNGTEIPLDAISLNKNDVSLEVGQTETLTVSYSPEDSTDDKIAEWTSSDLNVAEISDGVITAKSAGSAEITVTVGDKSATCIVNITEPAPQEIPLVSISLNKANTSLEVGESETLMVSYFPEDTTDDITVIWESSNPDIVEVVDGTVTAVAEGSAPITAIVGDKIAVCTVNVFDVPPEDIPLSAILINKTEASLEIGETELLILTFDPEDTTDDLTVIWLSSNEDVAEVSGGIVTAKSEGTVTITAKVGELEATCELTVIEPLTLDIPLKSITLNKAEVFLTVGNTDALTVIYSPSDTTDSKTITWSSSDPSITDISDEGVITAKAAGTATITAEVGDATASCAVIVTAETPIPGEDTYPGSGAVTIDDEKTPLSDLPPNIEHNDGGIITVGEDGSIEIVPDEGFVIKEILINGEPTDKDDLKNIRETDEVKIIFEWINPFVDINEHDWFYYEVVYALQNGLFNGTSATTFSPHLSMTRGMVVTVLGRLAGIDIADYKGASFDDVSENVYYAPYVKWTAGLGIVNGVGDNKFAPNANISRQDLAVILCRYAEIIGATLPATEPIVTFTDDGNIEVYAKEAVTEMQKAGIIKGRLDGGIDPKGDVTRAEVAAMFHRFCEAVK